MTFLCPPEGEWLGTIKVLCLGVGGFLSHLGDDIRHPSVPFGALTCLSRKIHFEFGKKIKMQVIPLSECTYLFKSRNLLFDANFFEHIPVKAVMSMVQPDMAELLPWSRRATAII